MTRIKRRGIFPGISVSLGEVLLSTSQQAYVRTVDWCGGRMLLITYLQSGPASFCRPPDTQNWIKVKINFEMLCFDYILTILMAIAIGQNIRGTSTWYVHGNTHEVTLPTSTGMNCDNRTDNIARSIIQGAIIFSAHLNWGFFFLFPKTTLHPSPPSQKNLRPRHGGRAVARGHRKYIIGAKRRRQIGSNLYI